MLFMRGLGRFVGHWPVYNDIVIVTIRGSSVYVDAIDRVWTGRGADAMIFLRHAIPSRDAMPNLTLNVNGETRIVDVRDSQEPLLYVLRNAFALTGAKFGCGLGQCGACKVIVDGEAVPSCLMPVVNAVGKKVTTIEGLGTPDKPHPLQTAFITEQAAQCGYCVTGMVMAGAALLARKPQITREDAQQALAGNLCRCGTHERILQAMLRASRRTTA
jgi:nicotinate dehydrogenase subunit A